MALAHDAQTRFPATDGPAGTNSVDTTTGDRTFDHTPSETPKGVVVVICSNVTSAVVTGVLYGTEAMTLTQTATDTSEAGRVDIYTLTEVVVPTGAQTVTLQGCTADSKWVTCSTVTAATNATKVNASNVTNTTTAANPTVSITTTATTLAYGGCHSGAAAPPSSPGGGSTLQFQNDYGAKSSSTLRRTSPDGSGTVTLTYTLGSDDHCIAGVALEEFTLSTPTPPPHAVMARAIV